MAERAFSDAVNLTLFGDDEMIMIDGVSIMSQLNLMIETYFKTSKHPANLLTHGIATRLSLFKDARLANSMKKKIRVKIIEEITKDTRNMRRTKN